MVDTSQPITAVGDELTDVELFTIAERLLAGWAETNRPGSVQLKRKNLNANIAVMALAGHAHRIGMVALRLLREGLVVEATPLVRQCYEIAVTCLWLVHVPDAVVSLVGEHARQRRATVRTLRDIDRPLEQEVADRIEHTLPDDWTIFDESPSRGSGQNFQQRCNDLEPGGAGAYAIYRALSQFSHASGSVMDFYLTAAEDAETQLPAYDPFAQMANPKAWTYILNMALVWAGRAVDMTVQGSPRRGDLRSAARSLVIEPELRMSDAASLRVNRAKSARQAAAQAERRATKQGRGKSS